MATPPTNPSLSAARILLSLNPQTPYETPNDEVIKAARILSSLNARNPYGGSIDEVVKALRFLSENWCLGGADEVAVFPSLTGDAPHRRSTSTISPRADTPSAIDIYKRILTSARTRHSCTSAEELEFTLADIPSALTITNLHKGWSLSLVDLLGAVIDISQVRGEDEKGRKGIEYTADGLVEAVRVLWGVDFGGLVVGAGTRCEEGVKGGEEEEGGKGGCDGGMDVDMGDEIANDGDDTRSVSGRRDDDSEGEGIWESGARRKSARGKKIDSLRYNRRYHPMDDILRPKRATKMSGLKEKAKYLRDRAVCVDRALTR